MVCFLQFYFLKHHATSGKVGEALPGDQVLAGQLMLLFDLFSLYLLVVSGIQLDDSCFLFELTENCRWRSESKVQKNVEISRSGSITGFQGQHLRPVPSFLGVLLLTRRTRNSQRVGSGLFGNLRYSFAVPEGEHIVSFNWDPHVVFEVYILIGDNVPSC